MRRSTPARWFAAVAALSLVAACGADDDAELQGMVRTPPLDVGSVTLPDASVGGQPEAMRAPDGELYLVYFGYTSCPDICPTTMSDITVALEDLPDDLADRVTVAMATVDPERDSAQILSGYLAHFFDHSLALRTDDIDELTAVTDAFGVQWEVPPHQPGDSYEVAHTAVTYVVDDTGTVVVEWPFGFETEAMTSDLEILLREDQT